MTHRAQIIVFMVLLTACITVAMLPAQAPQNLAGQRPAEVYISTSANTVKNSPIRPSSATVSHMLIATAAEAVPIVAIANRDRLIVRTRFARPFADEIATAAWINIGAAVATPGHGIRIDYYNPFDMELGAGIEAAIVATGTDYQFTIIQTARE